MPLFLRRRCSAWLLSFAMLAPAIACAQQTDEDPFVAEPTTGKEPAPPLPRRNSTDADVLAALQKPVALRCAETPLKEVAAALAAQANINIDLDAAELDEVGLGTDTPITFQAKNMRLKSAVNHLLRELDLDYTVRDGAIFISTPETLEEHLIAKLYPIDDLIDDEPWPRGEFAFDELYEVIQATIEPVTWVEVGGVGSLEQVGKQLHVRHTFAMHQRIEQFLAALRQARGRAEKAAADGRAQPPVMVDDMDHAPLRAALQKRIKLEAIEMPLEDVVDQLSRATGVNVLLNRSALEDKGVASDTPVTHVFRGAPLELELPSLLRQLDLTWEIRDEALLLTSPEEAEARLHTRIYPLVDLLQTEPGAPLIDVEGCDYDLLIEFLIYFVRPTSWDEVGGAASAAFAGRGCLAIAQTSENLTEIDGFFAAYRQALARSRKPDAADATTPIATDEAEHAALRTALRQKVKNVALGQQRLDDAVKLLSQRFDLPIRLDTRALEEGDIAFDTQVTVALRDESLGAGLRQILHLGTVQLTWELRAGEIWITTPACERLQTSFYPLGDFADHVDDLVLAPVGEWCEELREEIITEVAEESWDEFGGPGAIKIAPGAIMIVTQTEENHEAVAEWLHNQRQMRKIFGAPRAEKLRTNAAGEPLFDRVYTLPDITPAEAGDLAEIVQALVAPSSWREVDVYAIRASMKEGMIEVRHTAKTHRHIYSLLSELRAFHGGGGLIEGDPPVARLQSLALPARHPANALDEVVIVRVLRLDPEQELSADKVAKELCQRVAPESWRSGGTFVRPFRGQLIIRQTRQRQREIEQHLKEQEILAKPWAGNFGFGGFSGFGGVF